MSRGIRAAAEAGIALAALAACSPSPSGPPSASVTASVTEEGYLVADGYVDGLSEDGGKCSFTFWSEGGGASRLSSTGKADGSRTACPQVDERTRTLWPGSYTAVLTYTKGATTVESAPFAFEIPGSTP